MKSDDPWSTSSSDVSLIRVVNWNLDQNLGETYEYALKWKIHDTLSRLGSSENTFTQVYVYEPETIKLNTDHYFIEQYNRQRAPQKKISRCLLASWNLDQNLGRIRNRRRHCSWTDTFFFSLILITIKNNSQFFLFLLLVIKNKKIRF